MVAAESMRNCIFSAASAEYIRWVINWRMLTSHVSRPWLAIWCRVDIRHLHAKLLEILLLNLHLGTYLYFFLILISSLNFNRFQWFFTCQWTTHSKCTIFIILFIVTYDQDGNNMLTVDNANGTLHIPVMLIRKTLFVWNIQRISRYHFKCMQKWIFLMTHDFPAVLRHIFICKKFNVH